MKNAVIFEVNDATLTQLIFLWSCFLFFNLSVSWKEPLIDRRPCGSSLLRKALSPPQLEWMMEHGESGKPFPKAAPPAASRASGKTAAAAVAEKAGGEASRKEDTGKAEARVRERPGSPGEARKRTRARSRSPSGGRFRSGEREVGGAGKSTGAPMREWDRDKVRVRCSFEFYELLKKSRFGWSGVPKFGCKISCGNGFSLFLNFWNRNQWSCAHESLHEIIRLFLRLHFQIFLNWRSTNTKRKCMRLIFIIWEPKLLRARTYLLSLLPQLINIIEISGAAFYRRYSVHMQLS